MVSSHLSVSYHSIPKTPPLFVDYLDWGKASQSFFPHHFQDSGAYRQVARALRMDSTHRQGLVRALMGQIERWGASESTRKNIAALADPDCFAVLTGQQVGLLSGPCYTIYKALAAIKLARHLTDQGIKTVPIFWMETYDHDLDEINHVVLLDRHSQSVSDLRFPFDSEAAGHSVGAIPLRRGVTEFHEAFRAQLPENSEFSNEVRELVEQCYRAGTTIGDAFAQMMSRLMGDFGLVLFDPSDPAIASLSQPLLNWALHEYDHLGSELAKANQAIVNAGFQPQIKLEPQSTFIFCSEGGFRRLLLREGDRVWHKGSDQKWSLEEAQAHIASHPEKFSASVALRPLLQDHLLPTIGYVGGPSEISYFAQLRGFYERRQRPMPVIVPRASFTLITHKVERIFLKYDLNFFSVFENEEKLSETVFERFVSGAVASRFDHLKALLNGELDQIKPGLAQTDPTLADALETVRKKMQYQLGHLKTRYIHAEERHHAIVTQHIQAVLSLLHPHRNLQERELNISYFLARYGTGILKVIYAAIEPVEREHKILTLEF